MPSKIEKNCKAKERFKEATQGACNASREHVLATPRRQWLMTSKEVSYILFLVFAFVRGERNKLLIVLLSLARSHDGDLDVVMWKN